jgi:hypothetical protein
MTMPEETPTTLSDAPRFCPDCGRAADATCGELCRHCGSSIAVQGYCPICEGRVRRRIGELCPKHDVKLLADDAEERPRLPDGAAVSWVTVKQFPDSLAVAAARIRLEAEGIPTFVEGERMGAPTMYRVATGGVKLQVPAEFAAEARVILDQQWSWPDDDLWLADDAPDGGEQDELPPEPDLARGFLIEMLVVLAIAIPLTAAVLAYWWSR